MATDNTTTVAPGVRRSEDSHWGYILEGSKEALISDGLAQESWFADGKARNKRGHVIRSKKLTVDGRTITTVMTNPKRQMFRIDTEFTDAEKSSRENARAAAATDAEARRCLELMPKSAEAYREHIVGLSDRITETIINIASDASFDGYQLHEETLAELRRLAGHMTNAIEVSKVVFNRDARISAEIKIRLQAAKHDPALQSLMQRIAS